MLFADEPTGALSVQQGIEVLDIMSELNQKGQTIVMVTHDLRAACRANRIVVVKDGNIEGILKIPKYEPENDRDREKLIFSYISGEE